VAKRIGIFAGTFDPVHNGHVTFALAAARVCDLDKVIFLPEREPRGKTNVTNFAHRLAMIRLAIKEFPILGVEELASRQFSVQETLPELQRRFKQARLTLLVGSDNAVNMNPTTWPDIEKLFKTADIAVGMRGGHNRDELQALSQKAHVFLVYTNYPHAAATKVRGGRAWMVGPEVHTYIKQHSLY
jgi:nicotinate-nucleotide adenylyltransferase